MASLPQKTDISDILVIRLSSMGDVILVSALFAYLTEVMPRARITFITDTAWAPLFAGDPRIATLVGVDKRRLDAFPAILAGRHFDRVVDLQNNHRSRRFTKRFFTGTIVSRFDKLHLARLLLLGLGINIYRYERHAALRYIQSFDRSATSAPDISIFPAAGPSVSGLRPSAPSIALFPFAAWNNKQWPAARFAEVGRHFKSRGWNVQIFGGSAEFDAAEGIRVLIAAETQNLCGKIDLPTLARTLGSCHLALGNDTGLSHLARALRVPTGMIFGATTRHFGFYPYGTVPYVVFEHDEPCRPCHAHGGGTCRRGDRPCLIGISAAEVIAGLENLNNMSRLK